ncbi:MAG: gliding motility-associated C-terminal domain-containing protein [Ferruginibacter sp.]
MNKNCFGKLHYGLLLIMMLFFSISSFAQQSEYRTDKWRFSDPKQFGFTVLDVQFYDNNFGIAVGNNGGIATTVDGGVKWSYGPFTFTNPAGLKVSNTFEDVHIASPTVAYAVGLSGLMAKTIDAGKTWSLVTTPLWAGQRNINTCWFFNKDTGYIAGQWNTADSIPKLYRTKDGGATWDSLAAPPVNTTTRVGYVQNATYAPIDYNVDAKAKEIYRIQFSSPTIGYITGQGSPLFPTLPQFNITSATTCALTTSLLTTGSQSATLVWKFDNGTLTDYSLTKERLGYSGNPATPFTCISKYGTVTPAVQLVKAFNIINDSTIITISFNNNTIIRIHTGKNDSTLNINRPGVYEKGKYDLLNITNPPTGYTTVPASPLFFSNPYHLKRAPNGKLFGSSGQGLMLTSVDNGNTWKQEFSLPQGKNYSAFSTWALDILPNGKLITMGQGGVTADSVGAGPFKSTYVLVGSGGSKVDFVDCSNGIVTGGAGIAVTNNGGNSWINKDRADFLASFYNINGFDFTRLNKCYFAVTNGVIYTSPDQGTTLDPYYSDFNYQMNDVKGFGTDTTYGIGYASALPTASRKSSFFRTTNAGTSWQTVVIAATTTVPAFTAPNLSKMAFPSRNVGYAAGTRNGVYKTTDGGTTWTSINPFPALNENVGGAYASYTSIYALDDNTVFVLGNIFTTAGFKRLYKTTDGGATWTDISNNMNALLPVGNMLYVVFSDINNGYVCGSNVLFTTNNGGTSWTMDIAPHGNINNAMGFAPRTAPASVPFANRKLFIGGLTAGNNIPTIMEYGDTLNVNVNSAEVVTNATCSNPLGGSITINATGAIGPYTYSINGGAFQSSNSFTGLTQGVKTITINDAFCGTLTKTVNVGFTDNLTLITSNDTAVCAGAPVPLIATSAATTYAWSPAGGLSNAAISNPVATVNSNTTYTVTASLNGCVKTKAINISTTANPVINAGPDKTVISGDVVTLEGSSANTNVQSVLWSPAATITGAVNALITTAKPTATTTYTLTVKNNNGCTSTDDAIVTVIPYCIRIMNAFTPNGDGTNDKWIVTSGGACTSQVIVNVFNRYGDLVYSNENYQNNWDGTYKGKPLPDATYYYVIKFNLISGSGLQLKGDVTILR